jgi:two-component system chemotaxis response regulator CheB
MSEEYVLDQPPSLTCPECGGALKKVVNEPIPKYVCHIGHELTGEAMFEAQAERIEWLLGGALAMLNERRELCRQLMHDGMGDSARLEQAEQEATETAEALRTVLNEHGGRQYPL